MIVPKQDTFCSQDLESEFLSTRALLLSHCSSGRALRDLCPGAKGMFSVSANVVAVCWVSPTTVTAED